MTAGLVCLLRSAASASAAAALPATGDTDSTWPRRRRECKRVTGRAAVPRLLVQEARDIPIKLDRFHCDDEALFGVLVAVRHKGLSIAHSGEPAHHLRGCGIRNRELSWPRVPAVGTAKTTYPHGQRVRPGWRCSSRQRHRRTRQRTGCLCHDGDGSARRCVRHLLQRASTNSTRALCAVSQTLST